MINKTLKHIVISENKNLYNFHKIYKIYDYTIIFKNIDKNIKNSLKVILLKDNKHLITFFSVCYTDRKQKLKEILNYIHKQNKLIFKVNKQTSKNAYN